MKNQQKPLKLPIIVLFGALGDLATRKIIPALFEMHRKDDLSTVSSIIGVAREKLNDQTFRQRITQLVKTPESPTDKLMESFSYCQVDFSQANDFKRLQQKLTNHDGTIIYYLSVHSDFYVPICQKLANLQLLKNSRVVLEKPLGSDKQSASLITQQLSKLLEEQQIFRIDHYLGKEAVQNVLALRLGNSFMEALWNRTHISHVEITVAEAVGVEQRGGFYDSTGAMRDMVQSHLLQLLSIIAMEPPLSSDPERVRDEKVRVLRALQSVKDEEVLACSIRGQYQAANGKLSYREEKNVHPDSTTETFIALKCWVNNWRWKGVPFYLRTGKRMPERLAQIIIHFNDVPVNLFPTTQGHKHSQALVIQLNPKDSLILQMMAKMPGSKQTLNPVELSLDFYQYFNLPPQDAYIRLLNDVIKGDLTLFVRNDEIEVAWDWVDNFTSVWDKHSQLEYYDCETWGPITNRINFITHAGLTWDETLRSCP